MPMRWAMLLLLFIVRLSMNFVSAMHMSALWSGFSFAVYRCRYYLRLDDQRHV